MGGYIFKTPAPFLKHSDEFAKITFWQYGMRIVFDGYSENREADANGEIEYKIIKVIEMPKPYKTRYFFRKRLIDPDSKILKWQALECCGYQALLNRHKARCDYEVI